MLDFSKHSQVPDLDFSESASSGIDFDVVLELCAVKLRDAVSGRFRAYRLKKGAISWYLMKHKSWYRYLVIFVTLVHLSLVTFEPVSSINLNPAELANNYSEVRDHVAHRKRFFVGENHSVMLPLSVLLEALCLIFHWTDIFVQYKLSGSNCKIALEHSWYNIKLAVVSLMSINSFVSIILVFAVIEHPFNLTRLLRPILLIEQLENVRKLLKSVLSSFVKIKYVLTALFFIIFFFAVVATALFRGVTGIEPALSSTPNFFNMNNAVPTCKFLAPSKPEGQDGVFCSSFSKNCLDYWKTIGHSWMHLFTVLTTANYPDVMMPVVECWEGAFIFFAIFIFLGLFFFLNLVLAIVTNSFSGDTIRDIEAYNEKKLFMLADSFAKMVLLTEDKEKIAEEETAVRGVIDFSGSSSSSMGGEEKVSRSRSATSHLEGGSSAVNRANRLKSLTSKQNRSSESSSGSPNRHSYKGSTASFGNMDNMENGQHSSSMDNVGWAWSRVKVRRGRNDPFSLLDIDHVDLSWQRLGIDEQTKEEYNIVYEKGDLVITSGIDAEKQEQLNLKKNFLKASGSFVGVGDDDGDDGKGGKGSSSSSEEKNAAGRKKWLPNKQGHRVTPSALGRMKGSNTTLAASSIAIRRIFVAQCQNTDSHPMSTGGEQKWKELRLDSKSWSNFTSTHFPQIDQEYALGHFNYLHDVKCPLVSSDPGSNSRPFPGQGARQGHRVRGKSMSKRGSATVEKMLNVTSLSEIRSGKNSSSLDVNLHPEYNVAFEDFMITLVPILDARRIDLFMGYKCNTCSIMTHAKMPCLFETRKVILLWFQIPLVNGMFDALVILNTILLVTEIAMEDEIGSDRADCDDFVIGLCVAQIVILCIFVVELATKVYAYGLPRFWRARLNQIDLLAVTASFIFLCVQGPLCGLADQERSNQQNDDMPPLFQSVKRFCDENQTIGYKIGETSLDYISDDQNAQFRNFFTTDGDLRNVTTEHVVARIKEFESVGTAGLQNFITMFRIIRIFRLFRVLRSVRVELRVVNKLIPLFIRFLGVLFFFFYIFGVVGMELFAGRMHYTIEAVEESSYGLNRYYMNTFDNIFATFMVLFELMVINNWNIIMEGYVAATGSEWTRLYFIVWFVVSVVVVMNVCAGFVIDAYSLLRPKMKAEVKYLSEILDESTRLMNRRKRFLRTKSSGGGPRSRYSTASNIDSSLNLGEEEEPRSCCGHNIDEHAKLKKMTLDEILSKLDTEYMVSTMPTVSKAQKNGILFDQQLQNQLGIRVREHEHSYNQLTKVFDDGSGDVEEEEEEEDEEDEESGSCVIA